MTFARDTAPVEPLPDALVKALKQGPLSLRALADVCQVTPGQALDGLLALQVRGINACQLGELWSLESQPATPEQAGRTFSYTSRADNHFLFGGMGDNHSGSKWERQDVLEDLYDRFYAAGCNRVFNAGNWLEGEDHKNKFDLLVHGMEDQVVYLVTRYPHRPDMDTYAITGEDHEGFFCRRESVDIGKFTERMMREAGRSDWHDLGFLEARVELVNANTGKRGSLVVMHPGGGSAYALSYRPQKILESMSGGEKPNVVLIGHYHKLSVNLIRNVWAIQVGCTQDQTIFMRKKNLEAHVGGVIVDLEQDPETGAIIACTPTLIHYYDKNYYNDRWKKTGPVVASPRAA